MDQADTVAGGGGEMTEKYIVAAICWLWLAGLTGLYIDHEDKKVTGLYPMPLLARVIWSALFPLYWILIIGFTIWTNWIDYKRSKR
jgi:hypothetical protein